MIPQFQQQQQQQTHVSPQRDLDQWFQNLQLQNASQYRAQQLTKTFKMPPRDHHYNFFKNPQVPNLKALNQHPLSGTKKAVVAKQTIQQLQNQKTISQRRAGPQIGRQLQSQQQASQESQETVPNSRPVLQEPLPGTQHAQDQNQGTQLAGEQPRQNILSYFQNRLMIQHAQLFQSRQPQQQTGGRRIIDAQLAGLEMPPQLAAYMQNNLSQGLLSQLNLASQYNVTFNDDDQVDPTDIQRQTTLAGYKLEKELNLMLKSQFQQILLNGQETIKQLPSMVALRCADLNDDGDQHISVGVDLFCVIDTSGSMRGQKIETVRESLTLLLEFLTPQDRLCLIIFSTKATRLTPLKRMTPENKAQFKECIKSQVIVFGGTRIASGTDLAFKQMRERKYKNFVTSFFILTDGQDGSAHQLIRNQIAQCPSETFSIHTFGYGATHSIELLTRISALGSGNCYIVENIELLGQYFADALGGLQSTVGKNVQIDVRLIPSQFTEINILKTYGAMWEEALAKRSYKIKLPYMIAGAKKEYVFELAMPMTKSKIKAPLQVPIVEASIKMISLNGAEYVKSTRLLLKFFGSPQGMPEIVEDIEVMESYARVSAADAIDDARRACEEDKNEQAMQMLQRFRESLERNSALKQAAGQTIVDLDSALKACDQRRFREFGAKQLQQMKWTSYIQSGVNSQFDERGVQLNSFASGYQNSKQKKMVYTIQQLQAKRI